MVYKVFVNIWNGKEKLLNEKMDIYAENKISAINVAYEDVLKMVHNKEIPLTSISIYIKEDD